MRTIEEIKADYNLIKSKTPKGYTNTDLCELEFELRQALIYDIPFDRLEQICQAEKEGRVVVLPCKVGDTYTGICQEVVPKKKGKGWETKRWLDNGVVEKINIEALLTKENAGRSTHRDIKELGKYWFVGENQQEEVQKALKALGGME